MKTTKVFLSALAALSFIGTACQKENEFVEEPTGKIHMKIIAKGDNDTRTILQPDGQTVRWNTSNEQLTVFETIDGSTTFTPSGEGSTDDGGVTMTFDVAFDSNETGTSYIYNALYPNSAFVEHSESNPNNNPESVKVITLTTQKATATSFDGNADLLVAKQVTKPAQQTSLELGFKRLLVVGKMTLVNVDSEAYVKSVKFSSPNKKITGRSRINLTAGEVVEYGYASTGKDYVETTYEDNIPVNNLTVFFTCFEFEIAAGEAFTVEVTTKSNEKFTKTVTIPESRNLAFALGKNTVFTVDMANIEPQTVDDLAGKDYIILGRNSSGSGNYAYMTSNLSSTSTTYYLYGATQVSANTTIDVTNSKVDFPEVSDYWTIEKKGDNYAIKSKTTNKYVSWNSGNSAARSDDAYEVLISAIADVPGMYRVSSAAAGNRLLQYNGNSGQERFAFYGGTQNNLFLIPVGADVALPTLVSITVSDVVSTSFLVGDNFVFDGKVTATYDDETTQDVTTNAVVTAPDMTTSGTKEVSVSYTERGVTKTMSYTITVSEKPVISMMYFNNEDWDDAVKSVSNAQGSFDVVYQITNPIGTANTAEVTIVSGSDWVVASNPSISSSVVTQVFLVSANAATGAPRTATIKLTYSNAPDVVFEVSQAAGDDYVEPTEFSVWEDDFSKCRNNTTALTSLSGAISDFPGYYSNLGSVFPMNGAIRVGKTSANGRITTPALSGITKDSANLTITFKAAGWNGKTAKITLSANSGTVTEGQTTITSEASMNGNSPSMTGTLYTFHVTGANNTTKITFDTTCAIGIDDLVITQTN